MKRMLIVLAAIAVAGVAAIVVPASSSGATGGLTASEVADLQYMREEEKLARDVYSALGTKWSEATVFARIAGSEQRHMDAVKAVLDLYGISDPAAGKAAGEFTDPKLQSLYDRLLAEGSRSLAAALGVGRSIEQADIADLEDAMAATDNAQLDRLYANLLRASQSHLQAFTSHTDGSVPARGAGSAWQAGSGRGVGPAAGVCTGDGLQVQQGAALGGTGPARHGGGPAW